MTYAHALKYAGSDPFEPEHDRDDIREQEMELLEQDDIYRKLAEVRWLADRLEGDLDGADGVPVTVHREVFAVIGERDAPLSEATRTYVDHWLAEYRSRDDTPDGSPLSEPADFGGGESTGVQDLL